MAINRNLVLITGKSASGKAQPLTSNISTPTGFVSFADILVGDRIHTEKGSTAHVTHVHEQGNKQCYRVTFNDDTSVECCDEHLWTYYRSKPDRPNPLPTYTKTLRNIMKMDFSQLIFKAPAALQKTLKKLPIPPYTLGCLLGDGCFTQSTLTHSASKPEIIQKMTSELLPGYFFKKNKGDNHNWILKCDAFTSKHIYLQALTKLKLRGKLAKDKHIPKIYLESDVEQRQALFRGLMDTDGSVALNNGISFYTTSPQLKKDIIYLAQSLGFIAWESYTDNRDTPCYSVRFKTGTFIPFTLHKHLKRFKFSKRQNKLYKYIKSIEYVGEVKMRCISVNNPTQLYITDGFTVTHNSASLMNLKKPEGVMYLNCESGKELPFRDKFNKGIVTHPKQVYQAFEDAEGMPEIHTIVVDSITFLMDMFESKMVLTSSNTMKAWSDYAQYFKRLMQHHVAESTKNVIMLAHTTDVLNESEMVMETLVKVKGSLNNQGIESYFCNVIAAKKMPLKRLEDYSNPLLNLTEEDELRGVKYIYQTMLTKATVNERIRGPMGMWDRDHTYIDNDAQMFLDHLHTYYN